MSGAIDSPSGVLQGALTRDGYIFVHARAMRELVALRGSLEDWPRFAASWNDLALDTYMADGGRYRRRRHAVFAAEDGAVTRLPHQPHYQSIDYNPLNGGVARWFEPLVDEVGGSRTMQTLLRFCVDIFGGLAPAVRRWRIEAHQFRIEARRDEEGRPTPEGLHRDGVDYVLVLLVDRQNILSGTTSVHAAAGRRLGSFTLTDPFDSALLEDRRVAHGVTAVSPVDPARPAHRDVLVVTLLADPAGAR